MQTPLSTADRTPERLRAAERAAALPPIDGTREHDVIRRIVDHASDHGVSETEARVLADQLIRLARVTQGLPTVSWRDASAA